MPPKIQVLNLLHSVKQCILAFQNLPLVIAVALGTTLKASALGSLSEQECNSPDLAHLLGLFT